MFGRAPRDSIDGVLSEFGAASAMPITAMAARRVRDIECFIVSSFDGDRSPVS